MDINGRRGKTMVTRRRRCKHPTTLAQRLAEQAGRLRERARQMPPGTEQTTLWRKVRQAETALRIDAWLSSPHSEAPGDVVTLLGKDQQKHSARSAPSPAAAKSEHGSAT